MTLVALAMGGLSTTAVSGVAFAGEDGAQVSGGSSLGDLFQQNAAQEGRQNQNCESSDTIEGSLLTGGRDAVHCASADTSYNDHIVSRSGGARAEGGSSSLNQQNLAQKGRQNNNCGQANYTDITLTGGTASETCSNRDGSRNRYTASEGRGARAEAGSSGLVNQQNTAQEGRQNNNCGNSNNATLVVRGGDARGACANKNASDSSHTLTRNGGSTARGGSGGSNLNEQTTAQEGGQNNNCDNSNLGDIEVTGGALSDTCVNKDVSRNRYTLTRNGGARAEGGSSGAGLIANQQTTAQEGGQNNNCDNTDNTFLPLDGSRESTACLNKDASRNDHTVTKRGGARVEGGSSVGNLNQQNTAQEGQQNNDCANSNFGDVEVTQGRLDTLCKNVDRSRNVDTVDISHGARAAGGSSGAALFQQNTAQEGRQNNSCGNSNDLTLSASGGRVQDQCVAVDRSTNIGSTTY
ncbi:hypothetical protein [Streptomyces anandii]|uniref:hypothetical protein n=1 Tax=Streptomyces anandii TaxID=285454 RepID=UPI001673197B|nr:hypothetical protein [Streptomyces anandii]GGX78913.1 hypothetical protein GCM10010510_24830 [Streptomyces anandii JCM 4720]